MPDLGSFGVAQREYAPSGDPDTFSFFGERFTVPGKIPPMLMLQLGAATTGKIDEGEGFAALWEALRCCLTVPGDTPDGSGFDRFYKLAVRHAADFDDLMALVMKLFEGQAARPTERQPASSAGLSPTGETTSSSPLDILASPVKQAIGPDMTQYLQARAAADQQLAEATAQRSSWPPPGMTSVDAVTRRAG